jgi:hypothetical protein
MQTALMNVRFEATDMTRTLRCRLMTDAVDKGVESGAER